MGDEGEDGHVRRRVEWRVLEQVIERVEEGFVADGGRGGGGRRRQRRAAHDVHRVPAPPQLADELTKVLLGDQHRPRQLRVDIPPERGALADAEPVRRTVHEVALLGLRRARDRLRHRRVVGRDELDVVLVERGEEHVDGEVAGVLVDAMRAQIGGGDARLVEQFALVLVQAQRDRREVACPEVRPLQQVVERVHAAERRELLLVVKGSHLRRAGCDRARGVHGPGSAREAERALLHQATPASGKLATARSNRRSM